MAYKGFMIPNQEKNRNFHKVLHTCFNLYIVLHDTFKTVKGESNEYSDDFFGFSEKLHSTIFYNLNIETFSLWYSTRV